MTISQEIYKSFEDIVGPEYISDDPVVMHPYSWRSGLYASETHFTPLFELALLPENTAQVQAIVKLCNKHKLMFKPSSTGWGAYNDASGPNTIKIDLRRMNRIIEINERNMYAVVEPYVISAQLHAELMKKGFTFNMCGAGSNCSALPLAAHQGIGQLSQSGSYGERNLLGVEWVTPDGDLIKLGSVGSTGDWFCGDGPGPSLRGVIRGNVTPLGGLGVYTKAAAKIYPWHGPNNFSIQGVSPNYLPEAIPPNFMLKFITVPSMDMMKEAQRKIGEAEIAFELMGFNAAMASANLATDNRQLLEYFERFRKLVDGPCYIIIIVGNSTDDFDYKTRVLDQIIKETEGKVVGDMLADPEIVAGCIWRWIRATASIREVFRATGCFGGEVGGTDVYDVMADYIYKTSLLKGDYIKQGLVMDDDTVPFTQSFEHGHFGHGELLIRYIPSDKAFKVLVNEFMGKANEMAVKYHFGVPGHVFCDNQHDYYGPHVMNYHLWSRKLKKSFDPNGASDATHYISAKDM
jgi:glycolate oxidase